MPIEIRVDTNDLAIRQEGIRREPPASEMQVVSLRAERKDNATIARFTVKITDGVLADIPGDTEEKSERLNTALSAWLADNTPADGDILGVRLELDLPNRTLRSLTLERVNDTSTERRG